MSDPREILVLARRDHLEAMRVAAGFTIFGHRVRLVFMDRPVTEAVASSEQAELLELAGIEPETTLAEMAPPLPLLDRAGLAAALAAAELVVNL